MKATAMRDIKEALHHYYKGRSPNEIATALDIGRSTVYRYVEKADEAGLFGPLIAGMTELDLEGILFPKSQVAEFSPYVEPD